MTRRRSIKGVLHGFLGTYTSRYSDYDGYWLFGMLVEDMQELRINLLNQSGGIGDNTPRVVAMRLAVKKFKEQLEKAGLTILYVREAHLIITKSSNARFGFVNGHRCSGYDVRFTAKAVSDRGKSYESSMTVFVAPHSPQIELRSARGM